MQRTENEVLIGTLTDSLVSTENMTYEDRVNSVIFPRQIPKSENYRFLDHVSKIQKVSEQVAIAWCGSLFSAAAIVTELKRLLETSAFDDIIHLSCSLRENVDACHLDHVSYILVGNGPIFAGFQSFGCETFDFQGGLTVVLAGTGGNFLQVRKHIMVKHRWIERGGTNAEKFGGSWVNFISYTMSALFLAEGRQRAFSDFATGGWYEITLIDGESFQKIPYSICCIDRSSLTKDIDIVYCLASFSERFVSNVVRFPHITAGKNGNISYSFGVFALNDLSGYMSNFEKKPEVRDDFAPLFVDSGFGMSASNFGCFCFVCSDGEFVGVEVLKTNRINFEKFFENFNARLTVDELFDPVLVDYVNSNVEQYLSEKSRRK